MSKIKECFTSRWGKEGKIMEVDYSQLEVLGLAILSKDQQLIDDINNDLDFHCVSASWVTGKDYAYIKQKVDEGDRYWKSVRKAAKRPRFELQYGAMPPTIAENNGWPLSQAEDYVNRYYERYPQVGIWQDLIREEVEQSAEYKGDRSPTGLPLKRGYHISPTGRIYTFKEYERKDKKTGRYNGRSGFSLTQMKNYPVQGFATGDIVPTMGGVLFKELSSVFGPEEMCMVNTVHDSYVFDVYIGDVEYVQGVISGILDRTGEIISKKYSIDIPVKLKYDISVGDNWSECK